MASDSTNRLARHVRHAVDGGAHVRGAQRDDEVEVTRVRPAHAENGARVFHDAGVPALLLPLRHPRAEAAREALRLERAMGVVRRPRSELASHDFQAVLPEQFDEYVWFDETRAVTPLEAATAPGLPETWPFGQ